VSQITSIENSLIRKNELETRAVPCFGSYLDAMVKATAQAAINFFL
jgi:hypothetical protein